MVNLDHYEAIIGREPDRLTIPERRRLAGKWIALELYTPQTLPVRRIAAVGETRRDCIAQLKARGGDPARHEFLVLPQPY